MKKVYRGYLISINQGKRGWYYFITKTKNDNVLYISEPLITKTEAMRKATRKVDGIISEIIIMS